MRIRVVRERCEAAGWCSRVAPEHFGRDARGFTVLLAAEVDPTDEQRVTQAVAMCPTGAIELDQSDTDI